ncbi:hypothetical protein Bbelb_427050 [Branchiostoma belcheri]|nr:hypothetical protein Bbelb_427050 [Branchiostoma belcheri]
MTLPPPPFLQVCIAPVATAAASGARLVYQQENLIPRLYPGIRAQETQPNNARSQSNQIHRTEPQKWRNPCLWAFISVMSVLRAERRRMPFVRPSLVENSRDLTVQYTCDNIYTCITCYTCDNVTPIRQPLPAPKEDRHVYITMYMSSLGAHLSDSVFPRLPACACRPVLSVRCVRRDRPFVYCRAPCTHRAAVYPINMTNDTMQVGIRD